MIPRLTLVQRIFAWLLWKYERFYDVSEAEFNCRNGLLRTTSLIRDYCYIKRARMVK